MGLAQFLPAILLFPISGHVSDRFERRNVLSACYAGYAVCFALLPALAERGVPSITSIYVVLVTDWSGAVVQRNCQPLDPAAAWFPEEHFPNAVAWNASIFQAATILGPSFGGIVYAAFSGPSVVYAIAMVTAIGATFSSFRIKPEVKARPANPMTLKTLFAGLHYIWQEETDPGGNFAGLFAVLLGGAVALLPVYARRDSAYRTLGTWGCCAPLRAWARRSWQCWWRTGRCVAIAGLRCSGPWRDLACLRLFSGSRAIWCFRLLRCCCWGRAT